MSQVTAVEGPDFQFFIRYIEPEQNEVIIVIPPSLYDDPAYLEKAQTFFGPSVRIIRQEKLDEQA